MNKTVIWTIIAIVVIVGIILLVSMGNDKTVSNTPGGTNLPDTAQAQYNDLATSTGNFVALDEAANQLE